MKSNIRYLLIYWPVLTLATLALYWALWWLIYPDFFVNEDWGLNVAVFDFVYCGGVTFISLSAGLLFPGLFRKALYGRSGFITMSVTVFVVNIVLAMCIDYAMNTWIFHESESIVQTEGMLVIALLASLLSMLTVVDRHTRMMADEQERNRKLELSLLKRQLDPHFLFNNLSAASGTLEPDSTAQRIINLLSKIYRYITTRFSDDFVAVNDTVELVRAYAELQSLRSPGQIIFTLDPSFLDCDKYIIPLSIQLLLENAVKHNKHSERFPIDIIISADDTYLTVKNTLNPISTPVESSKIGLENLNRRYHLLVKRNIVVEQTERWFIVKLPLIDHKL